MRRFLLFTSLVPIIGGGALAVVACGSPFGPTPPDLVTIRGQVTAGGVGVPNAIVYGFDESGAEAGVDSGKPFSQLTDGTGHFAYYGFGKNYDLLVSPPGAPNDFRLVRGLSRRDPQIQLPLPEDAPVHTTTISPTWSPMPPDGSKITYFLTGPTYPGIQLVGVMQPGSDPNGPLVTTWRGGESTTVNLWALVYTTDANGVAQSWLGYGSAFTYLLDHRLQAFTIAYQNATTSPATLDIHAPDGFTVNDANLSFDFGYLTTRTTFFELPSPQGTQTFTVPDAPFLRLIPEANATNGGASARAFAIASVTQNQTSAMTIDLPEPPALVSPDDGATVAASSTFSVQSSETQEISFTPADSNAPTIRVITTEGSVTLDQVAAWSGLTLPAGAKYSWQSKRWRDFPTTDAFEGPGVDLPLASFATSAPRTFTIASP